MTKDNNEETLVEKRVNALLSERRKKGRKTYGHGLEHTDNYNWIDMAIEEALDLTQYLVAEQVKQENLPKIKLCPFSVDKAEIWPLFKLKDCTGRNCDPICLYRCPIYKKKEDL